MKTLLILLLVIGASIAYTLSDGTSGPTQGTVTYPDSTSLLYTHDGSEIGPTMVLDSFQVHATDAAGNVGPDAWIFVKITPVDNAAPIVSSDTIVCAEGGSVTWSPTVTDADTP